MSSNRVKAGAQAPERLTLRIANAASDTEPLDLDTVTDVTVTASKPDGSVELWPFTILEQTGESILLEHVYAVTDVWAPGSYSLAINLAVPGGVRRAGPTLLVVDP